MGLLRGIAASTFIFFNTVLVWIPLTLWIIQRVFTRGEALVRLKRRMDNIIWWWTGNNRRMIRWLGLANPDITWHDQTDMSLDKWYLVVCNHQSWTDILLLQSYLYGVIPPLKFFTKEVLIWVPGIGLAMYVLGFPYVKRATKEQIKANPKLKSADRENVARACAGFKNHPTSILNFIEGTRRTAEKQTRQRSEYKFLLRPKIGGLDYVVDSMSQHLHKLIDVTIIYPDGTPTFWEFLQGKTGRIVIEVAPLNLPAELNDAEPANRRTILAQWIRSLWQRKDRRIAEVMEASS